MSGNDVIVLNAMLEQRRNQVEHSIREDDFFELFSFEQVLKDFDLSYEEIESGQVGAGGDGGIDGFFMFVNDELVTDDFSPDDVKRSPTIDLFLIQSKQTSSFAETAIDKIISTTLNIFDLSKTRQELSVAYNSKLVQKVEQFKETYVKLAVKHPTLLVKFVYASKGDTNEIHPKVLSKTRNLVSLVKSRFSGSDCTAEFLGARELLDTARTEKTYTLQLRFLENYISRGEDNYVVLVKLTDYFDFVTDEKGLLRRYIFESNVRDYQGEVEVNKDIRKSLDSNDGLDFWYLNNGVTILASKASVAGKTITLDDIQIVNGLQTTTTIYNYITAEEHAINDNRGVLIRIIVTQDAEARDRIIKATNNQTNIPTASLRATDRIQRDIEDFMLQHGWFYDRRKNFYKNSGKPLDKIVSISYLAQCVMAIVLMEPDNARARPSSLIKRNSDYNRVFNDSAGFNIYLACASLMKRIESMLKGVASHVQDYVQFRFHLGMVLVVNLLGKSDYTVNEVASLNGQSISDNLYRDQFGKLIQFIDDFKQNHGGTLDQISKSREFVNALLSNIDMFE
jgi:hypothetical protein